MHKLLNACLVMAVLVSAYVLYSHEHATRSAEREITKIKSEIAREREATKLLGAEWASLTRPDRLAKLAAESLGLQPVKASQFTEVGSISSRIPQTVEATAGGKPQDAIGDIIQEMQR